MSRDEKKTMRSRLMFAVSVLCLSAWLAIPAFASAAAPKWSLSLSSFPSSFSSGTSGNPSEGPAYAITAENSGDAPTTTPYTITDILPPDLSPATGITGKDGEGNPLSCEANGQEVTCTGTAAIQPGQAAEVIVPVDVAAGAGGKSLLNKASVEGGGADPAQASLKTAVGQPGWKLSGIPIPTYFEAGEEGGEIILSAVNVGGAITNGPITVSATLPDGLTITNDGGVCPVVGQTISCTESKAIPPGGTVYLEASVDVDLLAEDGLAELAVEGGGAAPTEATMPITISPSVAPFGFLAGGAGFAAPLTSAEGAAETQAGSHPYQLTVELGWPTERPGAYVLGAGHVRNSIADLPPGMIVNPNSTAELCVEAQLVTRSCPANSQIGIVTATVPGPFSGLFIFTNPIYNMVAAPGTPAIFGLEVETGLFVHIVGSLRSNGDYGLSGESKDILAQGGSSVLGVRLQLWGDPSRPAHDYMRGKCAQAGGTCPAEEESKVALLTAPVQCSGEPTITRARTDSWEETGNFKTATYESADLEGNPVATGGCNQLQYEPSIEAKPTTNLADSPSGLDVDIHQPTNEDPGGLAPAMMKDIRLALPEGMSVNPSSADGLGACSEAQAHVHTLIPSECPGNSKLGVAEVVTPLQKNPLSGALYLAEPLKNPKGALIGLYLAVNDPVSGTVSNLAGEVQADPVTGRLTTVFEDNPQLPLEHIRTHLFTGPRAALRTPAYCGGYASKAELTPWSAPETPTAQVSDPWQIEANPNGGRCPQRGEPLPNTPSFTAGTLSPQAGDYSTFLFRLTRKDDTAEPVKVDTTLPAGLTAKLAGVPYCPEAAVARAQSRSKPNEGILERNDPSCPAASKVGTIDVATGAGITPLHTQGNVYLTGPYKGAPLSLAIITPAIAGPFDLGVVVARVALNVDPETAKVTAVSDPLPSILYGIPLDIRSIAFQMDRPDFTLNPTSCDPMSITGSFLTATGGTSPLLVPFQVGNCSSLGFKPKLALRLKGGTTRGAHPALSATLTFPKTGKYANVRMAQVTLPRSEFLDQAHIGTVCTRVQFAADQCPARSIYGKATATTPLLDAPLSGPVYLRSSNHQLPDLVAALHGQVDVVLVGRIDSVNGGIRNTFEAAPDAPVSKFTLQMQGGRKGLLVNSRNLCRNPKANKAKVLMEGQNGKVFDSTPALANSCKKKAKKRKKHAR